ncbi:MAG: hypothetical protein WBB89_21235 [Candidatus Acidiferrum sp.]|jgi:hypothetical protein
MKLSGNVRGQMRLFGFYLANRTLDLSVLRGIDYSPIFSEASALEQTVAIFVNVLDLDEAGKILNASAAHRRAAQYIRSYIDPAYEVDPPFDDWELELA